MIFAAAQRGPHDGDRHRGAVGGRNRRQRLAAVRATRAGRAEVQQRLAAQNAQAQAVDQQQKAESQEQRADTERLRAEGQLWRAERLLYTSKLLLAQNDFEAGSGGLTAHYLDETKPNLRGWEYRYLSNRINSKLTLTGHGKQLSNAVFSPDGTRVATSGHNGTARVWDAITGMELLILQVDRALVMDVAFSPDGKRIVTGGGDMSVKLWDAESGQDVFVFHDLPEAVYSLAFSPDGKRLAAGFAGINGTVNLWYAPSATAK